MTLQDLIDYAKKHKFNPKKLNIFCGTGRCDTCFKHRKENKGRIAYFPTEIDHAEGEDAEGFLIDPPYLTLWSKHE